MLVKIIILFLCAMALIAMVGKLLFPGATPRLGPREKSRAAKPVPRGTATLLCHACGHEIDARGQCACPRGGKA